MKHTNKLLALFFMAALLTGCAFIMGPANGYVTMMQRDTGKTYRGTVVGDRVSKATMNITLDGVNYTGTFVLAESNESVTIGSSFGNSFGNASANVYGNGGRYASAYGSSLSLTVFSNYQHRVMSAEAESIGHRRFDTGLTCYVRHVI